MRSGTGDGCSVLEAGDLGAEDKVLRGADSFDGVQYFLPEEGELAGEVKHWNGLRGTDGHICHGISLVCSCGDSASLSFCIAMRLTEYCVRLYNVAMQVDYCRRCSYC